ncbi:MAG: hypothetical protein LBE84_04210, partial [Planctomycetota bacterium]|nr:hypothetical protein [Planctomycetota bacterium]
MSLKQKLWCGFGLMILFSFVQAAVSFWMNLDNQDLARIQDEAYAPQAREAANISTAVMTSGYNFVHYQFSYDDSRYETGRRALDAMDGALAEIGETLRTEGQYLPAMREEWDSLNLVAGEYRRISEKIYGMAEDIRADRRRMDETGMQVTALLSDYYAGYRGLAESEMNRADMPALTRRFDRYVVGLDQARRVGEARLLMAEALASIIPETREAGIREASNKISIVLNAMKDTLATTSLPEWQKKAAALVQAIETWIDAGEKLGADIRAMNSLAQERINHYQTLVELTRRLTSEGLTQISESSAQADVGAGRLLRISAILGGASLLAGTLLAMAFAGSIYKRCKRIIEDLTEGADKVKTASASIKEASDSLAEGVTEQAASLEETSSILEEIASVTHLSSDNVKHTLENTENTVRLIGEGSISVKRMTEAMGGIDECSEQIGKIIKTIQEIAF